MNETKNPKSDSYDNSDPDTTAANASHLKDLLKSNLYELIEDIIPPIRVILATFIVFFVFLIIDKLLIWIFRKLSSDIAARVLFFNWVLDGVELLSAIGIAVYFAISGISNLQTQWRIAKRIEKNAGIE